MKKTVLILCLFSSVILLNAQSLNDSLLLYYRFNGDASDISGNNFDGSVLNAVIDTGVSGLLNGAYYFNGTNSCINLPQDEVLEPQLPVSFSFWVQFDDLYALYSQILTTDYTLDTYTGIWLGLHPDTYELQASYGDGTTGGTTPQHRRTKQGTTALQTGVWYFIAIIMRGAQDMDIYINCENDGGQYTGTGGPMVYSSNPGSIGRVDVATMAPYYFKGSIDEVRYWNRALTQTDIDELCRFSGIYESSVQEYQNLLAYPNPVNELLNVDIDFTDNQAEYTVFDMLGQRILTGTLTENQHEINVSEIATGYYMLMVIDGNQILNAKFVKE